MRAFMRASAVVMSAVVIAMLMYVCIVFAGLRWSGTHDSGDTADVIVVMGAAQYDGVPSPLLKYRLEHVLDLWKTERAPLIAVTGGKKPGDRFTEAATSQRWLIDAGVPSSVIITEDTGRSTWESLVNLAPRLRAVHVKKVVMVSDSWHVERATLSLRELGFSVSPAATTSSPLSPSQVRYKTIREVVGVSIGRIVGFGYLFNLTG